VSSESLTLAEQIQLYVKAQQRPIRTSIPGKITKFNAETQTADILLLVKEKLIDPEGESTEFETTLSDVPVMFPASDDDVYISLPVAVGSLGEVRFSDRPISEWTDSDGSRAETAGDDRRTHDLSFAYFQPGLRPLQRALSSFEDDAIVLKNKNLRVAIKNDTFAVENSTAELISLLFDAINELSTCTAGGSPLSCAAALTNIALDLNTFKE
jgi:hypothetical protein